jgi:hypothetical protein
MTDENANHKIDRLLDAIELLKIERRAEARQLLRELIQEDGNFEDAWLWMSVAVDSLDQSSVCLDNVLRVNPRNVQAAGALHRLRGPEMLAERRRSRFRMIRDLAFASMWILTLGLLFALWFTFLLPL